MIDSATFSVYLTQQKGHFFATDASSFGQVKIDQIVLESLRL